MKRTGALLGVVILGLLAIEAWALLNASPGDTISETVWLITSQQPWLTFLAGFLAGHLFWQSSRVYRALRPPQMIPQHRHERPE